MKGVGVFQMIMNFLLWTFMDMETIFDEYSSDL